MKYVKSSYKPKTYIVLFVGFPMENLKVLELSVANSFIPPFWAGSTNIWIQKESSIL